MLTAILTILLIGLLLLVAFVAIIGLLFKKGLSFFKYSGRRHVNSSGWKYRSGYGHHSYGHKHYRRKSSSHGGFFSS